MKLTLLTASLLFSTVICLGQTSVQDFGTGTGSFTSQTGSTGFIPNPTSGTSWTKGGAVVPNAPVNLVTASNTPLGTTGSCIKAAATNSIAGADATKFSPMVNYTGSTEFYTSFKVLFGDASAGNAATTGSWIFFQGSGAMYSDGNGFSDSQVFSAIRFSYSDPGIVTLDYRSSTSFVTTGLTTTSFNQGTVYTVEIFGNNKSSGTITYKYGTTTQTVAINKFDLYINGVRIGDDLSKALLGGGSTISATNFFGLNSTNNEANIFVDDVKNVQCHSLL